MDPIEQQVRKDHPEWNDEQVAAEVVRLKAQPPEPPPPTPPPAPAPENAAFAEMRRQLKAAEDRAKALEEAEAERQRKQAEETGEFKRLYEEEKARNDRLQSQIDQGEQNRRAERLVSRVAADLHFRNTDDAVRFLSDDIDRSDEDAVRKALEQLAKDRDYLVTKQQAPPSGRPPGGGDPNPEADITYEQLQGMTAKQIAALPKEKLDKALASAP